MEIEKIYIVKVDDNFSPGSDIWENGRYKTYEEALEKCKEITRDSFGNYKETWSLHGEDPFIVCEGGVLEDGQRFSAREYVKILEQL